MQDFGSLLTTFKVGSIFWAAGVVFSNWPRLTTKLSSKVRSVQISMCSYFNASISDWLFWFQYFDKKTFISFKLIEKISHSGPFKNTDTLRLSRIFWMTLLLMFTFHFYFRKNYNLFWVRSQTRTHRMAKFLTKRLIWEMLNNSRTLKLSFPVEITSE